MPDAFTRVESMLAAVTLLTAVGCVGAGDRSGEAAVGWDEMAAAEVAATIGMLDGPPEQLFGDITSVAVDPEGRVYVADRIGSTLRVYGPDGEFLRQLGREGGGPGEYEWPAGLTFGPEGRLYVRDARRVTVLASRRSRAIPDSVVGTWRIPGFANLDSRRGRVDSSGNYYYPAYQFAPDEPPRYIYLVYPNGDHGGDTVHVPQYRTISANRSAFYWVSAGTGRSVEGLGHAPFEPVAAWDLTPRGTVIGGDGTTGTLVETDAAGDTVGGLSSVRTGRRPVPPSERADSVRALDARVDSLPVPLSDVQWASDAVRAGELPDSLPAFRSTHIAANGDVWIEQWPPEDRADEQFFDVYSSDGEYRGSISLPDVLVADPPPYFTDGSVYGVIHDPDTEVERVLKLTFTLGAESGG